MVLIKYLLFRCFKHYWTLVTMKRKVFLALLFELSMTLLRESYDIVNPKLEKELLLKFDDNIEKYH